MPEPAGSRDDHPPHIIGGNEYEFVAVAEPENHYSLRFSSQTAEEQRTRDYVVGRLRDIADRIEATSG
jgi:hypothetical protein